MTLDVSWCISAMTLASMWLAGSKNKWAWILGILNQGFWLVFVLETHAYGLLPLSICLTVIYARNLWNWTS